MTRQYIKTKRLWGYLSERQAKGERPPTCKELLRVLDLRSTATVHHHLSTLRDIGYITWQPGTHGTLHVLIPYLPGRIVSNGNGHGH